MRPIKLRAWDKQRNIMGEVGTWDFTQPYPDPYYVLMKFTGLCDKNGTPIYEGDVIIRHDLKGVVEFGQYHDDGDLDGPVDFVGFFIRWDDDTCSQGDLTKAIVIGNIFNNPELIQE